MLPAEQDAGITFESVGIDVSRCRGSGDCKTQCPNCHHTHSPAKQRTSKDLSVNLGKGAYNCHRCDFTGSLTQQARQHNWQDRIQPRKATPVQQPPKQSASPDTITLPPGLHPWAIDFLKERGINPQAAQDFMLRSDEYQKDGETVRQIHAPYLLDGSPVNVKGRTFAKRFWQTKGGVKCLYNVDRAEGSDVLVITEGEFDTIACHMAGWVAVSTPDGAPGLNPLTGKTATVGHKLDALLEPKSADVLANAKRIVLATDGDEEGKAFRAALIDHLGPARCWQVEWPKGCKDANDVLREYGADRLNAVLGDARPVDLPGISNFMTEWDALQNIWANGYDPGVSTGWPELDPKFRVRRGTVTTVSGIPGNGKTSFLFAMFAQISQQHDWRWAVFSPEAGDSGSLLGKLVQIANDAPFMPGADQQMSLQQLRAGAEWVADHFYRIDATVRGSDDYDSLDIPKLIGRMEALVLRYGIQGAVIDPWNRLEAARPGGMTETEYVAWAINSLSRFAQRHNVALFVVCHPHKMQGGAAGEEEPIPSPYQIAGSAHWYNMSDQILGIGRNKFTEPLNETTVVVQKVREEGVTGNLGIVKFYYDAKSRRYYGKPGDVPMNPGSAPYVDSANIAAIFATPAPVGEPAWDDSPI